MEHLRSLEDLSDQYLDDLAFTLSSRRGSLPWKSFAVAGSIADLLKEMQKGLPRPVRTSVRDSAIHFIFTGQGANWALMAEDLYVYPIYRDSLERTQRYLSSFGCKWNIKGKARNETSSNDFLRQKFR